MRDGHVTKLGQNEQRRLTAVEFQIWPGSRWLSGGLQIWRTRKHDAPTKMRRFAARVCAEGMYTRLCKVRAFQPQEGIF